MVYLQRSQINSLCVQAFSIGNYKPLEATRIAFGGFSMQEIWKDVVGWEGQYKVSNMGRVKSIKMYRYSHEIILKPELEPYGYFRVNLSRNGKANHFRVSRLVAAAFIPNPEHKTFVNHINNIRNHNYVVNLEWCTPKENAQHAANQNRMSRLGRPRPKGTR